MSGWFKVFLSIWLIFFSMSYAKSALYLIVLAAIIFVVAMMEVIKKK